jgi:hypothetical protein
VIYYIQVPFITSDLAHKGHIFMFPSVPFIYRFNCIYKLWENYNQILCPFHWTCKSVYHFTCRKGNNLHKKGIRAFNLRIKSGMYKRSITHTCVLVGNPHSQSLLLGGGINPVSIIVNTKRAITLPLQSFIVV